MDFTSVCSFSGIRAAAFLLHHFLTSYLAAFPRAGAGLLHENKQLQMQIYIWPAQMKMRAFLSMILGSTENIASPT